MTRPLMGDPDLPDLSKLPMGRGAPITGSTLRSNKQGPGARDQMSGERERLSISRSKIMKVYLEPMLDFAGNPKWHRPE